MDARELSEVFADSVLPVTIFFGVLALFGVVGNASVLYVYKHKYPHGNFRTFVMFLALTDLVSCLIVFPSEIVGHRVWFSYPKSASWFCKLKTTIFGIAVLTSSLILLLISIDRFRKVCRPFGWQLRSRYALRLCILTVAIGIVLTFPIPVLFGIQTQNITYSGQMLEISSCQKDDLYKDTSWMTVYVTSMYYTPVIAFMLTTTVLYGLILEKIYSGKLLSYPAAKPSRHVLNCKENSFDALKLSNLSSGDTADSTNTLEIEECGEEPLKTKVDGKSSLTGQDSVTQAIPKEACFVKAEYLNPDSQDSNKLSQEGSPCINNIIKQSENLISIDTDTDNDTSDNRYVDKLQPHHKMGSRRRISRKTVIMFTVTLIFNITMIVYFCSLFVIVQKQHIFELASTKTTAILFLCWRIYFINHVINPVVYGLLDKRFRHSFRNMPCPCSF